MTKHLGVWAVSALLVVGVSCSKENEPKDDDSNSGLESSDTGGGNTDNSGDNTEETPAAEIDLFPELEYDELVYVEGGTFLMGAQSDDPNGLNYDSEEWGDESPVHEVTLESYYIGRYEVTQGLWKKVMGTNLSTYTGDDNLPVDMVSWNDCQEFIFKLNEMTGKRFRLPTEAEWEYAARGGQQDEYTRTQGQSGTYYKYPGSNNLYDVAWCDKNSEGKTHPVGTKSPNALGLYDMSGNVYEWCNDFYDDYDSTSQTNPAGPDTGSWYVMRGGCWRDPDDRFRVSFRFTDAPDARDIYGLRLVLPL